MGGPLKNCSDSDEEQDLEDDEPINMLSNNRFTSPTTPNRINNATIHYSTQQNADKKFKMEIL